MQPRLYRLGPKIEEVGGFLDAHFFDQPRHQDDAERLGQRVNRAFEYLVLSHGAFGIRLR